MLVLSIFLSSSPSLSSAPTSPVYSSPTPMPGTEKSLGSQVGSPVGPGEQGLFSQDVDLWPGGQLEG